MPRAADGLGDAVRAVEPADRRAPGAGFRVSGWPLSITATGLRAGDAWSPKFRASRFWPL